MFLVLTFVAGCASPGATQPGPPRGTPSASGPGQSSTAALCMSALVEGQLVTGTGPGVNLKKADGSVKDVIWPDGYTFSTGDKRTVTDGQGTVVARVGDTVELGGGESGPDNAWKVCSDHIVVTASAAP